MNPATVELTIPGISCAKCKQNIEGDLVGRGPAVVVGTRGVLAYLHSLGVCTWSDQIAEQYDCRPDADQRLAAAMDSALEYISRTGTDDPGLAEVREANLRWLVSAPKPWDRLVGELCDTVRWLG